MSGFEAIINQKHPLRLLKNLLRKGAIPHAILFLGIEGVGKETIALYFAMACNCTGKGDKVFIGDSVSQFKKDLCAQDPHTINACGVCKSCRKILSGNHPDIIVIKPLSSTIRIAQIRELGNILALKPYEARLRVVVISRAETMSPEAANAILKMLEEPPDQTILILTAIQTSDLLPTVVSRCQHIRFNPISPENLETFLIEKQGIDPDDAKIVVTMANGSFSKAFTLIKSMDRFNCIKWRNWLLQEVEFLSSRPTSLLLAFAAKLATTKKEIFQVSMEVIKSWFRDIVVYKYYPEKVINKDLIGKIQSASRNIDVKSLLSKIEAIESAQKELELNANPRLTMEALTVKLAGIAI